MKKFLYLGYLVAIFLIAYYATFFKNECVVNINLSNLKENYSLIKYSFELVPTIKNLSCVGAEFVLSNNGDDFYIFGINDYIYHYFFISNPFIVFIIIFKFKVNKNKIFFLNFVLILTIEYIFKIRYTLEFINYNIFVYPLILYYFINLGSKHEKL